eukprot:7174591-Prymnesium_polylepis.2
MRPPPRGIRFLPPRHTRGRPAATATANPENANDSPRPAPAASAHILLRGTRGAALRRPQRPEARGRERSDTHRFTHRSPVTHRAPPEPDPRGRATSHPHRPTCHEGGTVPQHRGPSSCGTATGRDWHPDV